MNFAAAKRAKDSGCKTAAKPAATKEDMVIETAEGIVTTQFRPRNRSQWILEDAVKSIMEDRYLCRERTEWVVQDRSFVYQMQTLKKLMKSLRKPDTLTNYS